ncbi:MAG: protein translocase subunit SecF [Cellvibrio sp.]|nr:protein translocase subunit SecF [Cellvibrio sp.]
MTQEKIIDFMGVRRITSAISIFLVLASIVCLSTLGLKGGLDFTGGTQLEILADKGVSIPQVRAVLEEEKLKSPTAVLFGSDLEVMIRTQDQMKLKAQELLNKALAENGQISAVRRPDMAQEGYAEVLVVTNSNLEKIKASGVFNPEQFGRVEIKQENTDILVAIEKSLDSVYVNYLIRKIETATGTNIELRSSEFVGPQIGDELRDQGGLGLLAAFFAVFLYVAVQFQWKFSGGAIIALVHDVTITLGFFSFFQWDFDLTVLAALLALIGYSINDTIVIYDRIRENFRVLRKMDPLQVINISLTQTLGRSIMTSMTVFLVLVVLFLFGGEVLHGFSKALLIGVVVGTYSSIYIAANLTVAFGVTKEDLMPKVHDNSEADQLP